MKLTMWVIRCTNDGSAYDVRATTKKEAIRLLEERQDFGAADYEETITRYTLEYANGFELLDTTAAEGGWEMLVTDQRSYPIRSNG